MAKIRRTNFLGGEFKVLLSLAPFFATTGFESAVAYNCSKCPGYCCSYPVIPLNSRDVKRLARHFGLSFKEARVKFTKVDGDEPYAMRRKADEHFGRI
ncbi:MAG TPA: hypothetical protein VMU31_11090, partial [Rhizomicrobium sp.]|nr:hypothetical protein [Rhizomicrobium sp.]